MKDIVKTQMEFFGHVIRMEELKNFVVTGFIEGKRARRRQIETYLTHLQKICLVTVVQIAAYVNMTWHTIMMMIFIRDDLKVNSISYSRATRLSSTRCL